ncbi:conserved hypothetical protein [Shewanella denitrificans OS217]|jgi:uncharacterized protein (DUF1800 family)|uniref:DUF1800 domain-containing protein n=1 Tax=Shewanella denitrificans (strain OS217 / ATCC BAA-1090 / DSM 15013) TaxID=318161 RepID=Q12Q02_SHEDO|nr:DUF1800 domain-containing protein [Shewanella denitrificans]ABE54474.1 conserved hypothetical protein [Shewanella denitrificans OS217]
MASNSYSYQLLFSAMLLLSACGGGSDDSASEPNSAPITPQPTAQAPVVNVIPLASPARQGTAITISVTASDADGIKSYLWQQIAGPSLVLSKTDEASLTFTPVVTDVIRSDQYSFRVQVTDNQGNSTNADIDVEAKRAMTDKQAGRLLHQATLGPTSADLNHATGISEHEWIAQQIALPASLHSPLLENYPGKDAPAQINRLDAWWKASLTAPDQLRQRVAFALSEIFVVSDANNALKSEPEGMTGYYDLLLQHAFGNYRDLLEAVTLSPVMGSYLSHLGNEKANTELNIRPDENFAREVMQLFTIGLKQLNLDGSPILSSTGEPIASYSQTEIEGFAHVFTGWTFAASARWNRPSRNFVLPMEPWEDFHSQEEKSLLNGTVLAGGQAAKQDLTQALDNLFDHPNVGPFIGQQLIQRLVTSNPSPQYIQRIAQVFNDNGQGVRGDLGATISAILLDDEARQTIGSLQYFGKIREPLLRTTHLWRELNAASPSGRYFTWSLDDSHGQTPLGSPSVFNFFRPDYQSADLLPLDLVAPELQIANDAALIGQFNSQYGGLVWNIKELSQNPSENRIMVSLQTHVDILQQQGLEALLNHYDRVYFSSSMTAEFKERLRQIHDIWKSSSQYQQVAYLLFTITISPDYLVQY